MGLSMFAVAGCGGSGSDRPRATSAPTATPTAVPRLSVQTLFNEREANAVRFDAERKGKWITVYGTIEKIESGDVHLKGGGFWSSMVLNDLSEDELIPLNRGNRFEATCIVSNFVLGSMFLKDCTTTTSG